MWFSNFYKICSFCDSCINMFYTPYETKTQVSRNILLWFEIHGKMYLRNHGIEDDLDHFHVFNSRIQIDIYHSNYSKITFFGKRVPYPFESWKVRNEISQNLKLNDPKKGISKTVTFHVLFLRNRWDVYHSHYNEKVQKNFIKYSEG